MHPRGEGGVRETSQEAGARASGQRRPAIRRAKGREGEVVHQQDVL